MAARARGATGTGGARVCYHMGLRRKQFSLMELRNQGRAGTDGYAMAALLVMLAVMAVMMSVAMPAWRQMVQREKEEELVFRGPAVRPRHRPLPAQIRGVVPAQCRHPPDSTLPAEEVQGPDERGRRVPGPVPDVGSTAGTNRARRQPGAGSRRADGRHVADAAGSGLLWRQRLRRGDARPARRHDRRLQQEHRDVHSTLQRPQPLQRVAVHLRADDDAGPGPGPAGHAGHGRPRRPRRDHARHGTWGNGAWRPRSGHGAGDDAQFPPQGTRAGRAADEQNGAGVIPQSPLATRHPAVTSCTTES